MNTCYKHFYYFVSEFSLVDKKELEPLVCVHRSVCCFLCNQIVTVVVIYSKVKASVPGASNKLGE